MRINFTNSIAPEAGKRIYRLSDVGNLSAVVDLNSWYLALDSENNSGGEAKKVSLSNILNFINSGNIPHSVKLFLGGEIKHNDVVGVFSPLIRDRSYKVIGMIAYLQSKPATNVTLSLCRINSDNVVTALPGSPITVAIPANKHFGSIDLSNAEPEIVLDGVLGSNKLFYGASVQLENPSLFGGENLTLEILVTPIINEQ